MHEHMRDAEDESIISDDANRRHESMGKASEIENLLKEYDGIFKNFIYNERDT